MPSFVLNVEGDGRVVKYLSAAQALALEDAGLIRFCAGCNAVQPLSTLVFHPGYRAEMCQRCRFPHHEDQSCATCAMTMRGSPWNVQ